MLARSVRCFDFLCNDCVTAGARKNAFPSLEHLKRRMDTGARDLDRTDTPPFGKAADFKNNLPAVELVLVRVLRGQFSLCNILCNGSKIGLVGFV